MLGDRKWEPAEGLKKLKQEKWREKEELKEYEKEHIEDNGHGAKVVDSSVFHHRDWVTRRLRRQSEA